MKIKAWLLGVLAAFFCASNYLSADIILLHGSKAPKSDWYMPPEPGFEGKKGLFYTELSEHAKKLGLGRVIPFTWSGRSGPPESRIFGLKQHIEAAERLTQMIRDGFSDRPKKESTQDSQEDLEDEPLKLKAPLYLVGHSNGGIISTIVTHMLYNPHAHRGKKAPSLFALDSKIMDIEPQVTDSVADSLEASRVSSKEMREDTSASDEDSSEGAKKSKVRTKNDLLLREKRRNSVTLQCRKLLAAAVARVRATYDPADRHQIKVAQLIMLASPIDVSLYSVNMKVADKVCALFSQGDGIQRFFGRSRYPQGDNIMNFRVAIKTFSGGTKYPLHTQMTSPCFARYLLELFSDGPKSVGISSSGFSLVKGIDVLIDERPLDMGGQPPEFKVITNLKVHAFAASGLNE